MGNVIKKIKNHVKEISVLSTNTTYSNLIHETDTRSNSDIANSYINIIKLFWEHDKGNSLIREFIEYFADVDPFDEIWDNLNIYDPSDTTHTTYKDLMKVINDIERSIMKTYNQLLVTGIADEEEAIALINKDPIFSIQTDSDVYQYFNKENKTVDNAFLYVKNRPKVLWQLDETEQTFDICSHCVRVNLALLGYVKNLNLRKLLTIAYVN
jgi:hypothetical protein